MNNTSRSIIYSFLQQISGLQLAARNCAGQSTRWPRGAFAHIGTGSPLWAEELQKLAPGLHMTTSDGTCGCGGPAYSHKWEKVPTFWSSDSSERERQIYGPISTFPIWLWKIRRWHTTLYVLSITPHLIKHWYYNHQFELGRRQPLELAEF